jgi:hypothetical protein
MLSKTVQIIASSSTLAVKEMEAVEALAEARTAITALAPLGVATATVPVNNNNNNRKVEPLEVSVVHSRPLDRFLISE